MKRPSFIIQVGPTFNNKCPYKRRADTNCLNRFKKIHIIQSIFSDHNGMELEINNQRKTGKFTELWKLSNTVSNNQRIKEEIKERLENT